MRKTVLLLVLLTVATFGVSGVAQAQESVLDQQKQPDFANNNVAYANVDRLHWPGQIFTAGKTGTLDEVLVFVGGAGGCRPTDDNSELNIVEVDEAGQPVGEWRYYLGPCWPDAARWVGYSNLGMPVVSGHKYYLMVRQSGSGFYQVAYNSVDSYAGGNLVLAGYDPDTGYFRNHVPDNDLVFETYVTPDTTAPTGTVLINDGAQRITIRAVTLNLNATDDNSGVKFMRVRNAGRAWSAWRRYATSKDWVLTAGEGTKTVYVQFRDAAGNVSARASDSITYRR